MGAVEILPSSLSNAKTPARAQNRPRYRGGSRTWFDDRGLSVGAVECQPSWFPRGRRSSAVGVEPMPTT